MTRIKFTPDQIATIEMLIADGCPPGEIGETVGVNAHAITSRFPDAKMSPAARKEWLSLRAFMTACEKLYDRRTDAPRLGKMTYLRPVKQQTLDTGEKAPVRKGPPPNEYPPEKLAEAQHLLSSGASYAHASRQTGLSRYVLRTRFPGMGAPIKRHPNRVPA